MKVIFYMSPAVPNVRDYYHRPLRRMLTLTVSIPTFIVGTLRGSVRYGAFAMFSFWFQPFFLAGCAAHQ